VGKDPPPIVEDAGFRGHDLAAAHHDAAFGAHPAGVVPDRAREIGFGLDARIADGGGEKSMPGAAGGAGCCAFAQTGKIKSRTANAKNARCGTPLKFLTKG